MDAMVIRSAAQFSAPDDLRNSIVLNSAISAAWAMTPRVSRDDAADRAWREVEML